MTSAADPHHAQVAPPAQPNRHAWLRHMAPRDPHEHHRAATPLELLFDLCFVVAIAQAAAHLHHGIAAGHVAEAARSYGLIFFAITWCWDNFSWFASAFDTDDAAYRLTALLQIVGALILAAGVGRAFEQHEYALVTLGYTVMRVGMIANWLRAAVADPSRRETCLRYALGLFAIQAAWLGFALVPLLKAWWIWGWLVLAPCELLIPVWAERPKPTSWHPHHIAERYSLLVLIVMGEVVLSTTTALQTALDAGELAPAFGALVVGSLLLVFSMWWLYFDQDSYHPSKQNRMTFYWGYVHMLIFAAVAAVGAGVGVTTDALTGHAEVPVWLAGAAVTVPTSVYILSVWAVRLGAGGRGKLRNIVIVATTSAILLSSWSRFAVLYTGVLCALLVTFCVWRARHDPRAHAW